MSQHRRVPRLLTVAALSPALALGLAAPAHAQSSLPLTDLAGSLLEQAGDAVPAIVRPQNPGDYLAYDIASFANPTDPAPYVGKAIWAQRSGDPATAQAAVESYVARGGDRERLERARALYDQAAARPIATSSSSSGAIVVLGAALNADRTPPQILIDRLDAAAELAKDRATQPVIVTAGPSAGTTEAAVMRTELINRGVAAERILIEDTARSTVDSALALPALVNEHKITSLTIVTSNLHTRRAWADLSLTLPATVAIDTVGTADGSDPATP